MNEDIEKDFMRFLRHEAMLRNTKQNEILEIVKNKISKYEIL